MFLVLPSANVSGGNITSLSGAALSTSQVVTAQGTIVAFSTASVSDPFTPTGSNLTAGPQIISGPGPQFLIVPDANFNAANEITSLSGVFVSASQNPTGLLSNVPYRAVTLTAGSGTIDLRTAPAMFAPGQWDVTNPNLGGVLTVAVSALPYNGGQPITDIVLYENNGSTPISTGLTAPGTFNLTGRGNGQTYSYVIAAQNSLGIGPVSTPKTQIPTSPVVNPPGSFVEDPLGFRGWSPSADYGTTYDFLVDPAGGGTHTTIAGALGAATSGSVVAVKAGVYTEAATIKSGVTLKGYGTDKPIISAQQNITGFVQCGAGDSGVLGSALGVNGSPVYKKTGIAKASVPVSDLLGINVMENLLPISNAQDRADKTFLFDREDEATYYNPVANGGNFNLTNAAITSIYDPTVITAARYTNAQLLAARVRLFADPNESYLVAVTAADVANNIISVGGGFSVNNDGRKRYAIGNMGFAMVPGSWVYVDNGGATFDLYVYPTTPANITKITIASIKNIITLATGSPANVTIKGIRFVGAAGQLDNEGSAIIDADNGGTSTGLFIENCKFTGFENIGQLHYAAVKLVRANNFTIQNCSFEYCAAHGVWPTGSLITQDGALMRRNTFIYCGSAGAKAYKQSRYAFFHNYHYHCGFRSHGNLGNVYLAGVDSIWFGNQFDLCQGYLTTKTVNPHALFNFAPCDSKSGQNRKFENQGGSGTAYFCNNSSPPVTNVAPTSGFMAMDWGFGGMTCYQYNNVGHGISVPGDQGGTVIAQYNLVTYNGYSGSVGGNLDPSDFNGSAGKFDTTNVLNLNLAAIYKDYLNRNWSPTDTASPLLTMQTFDIRTIINTLKATFPMVPAGDWDRDCFNNVINYAALKIGADQGIIAG